MHKMPTYAVLFRQGQLLLSNQTQMLEFLPFGPIYVCMQVSMIVSMYITNSVTGASLRQWILYDVSVVYGIESAVFFIGALWLILRQFSAIRDAR